jgi:hypothetical protein
VGSIGHEKRVPPAVVRHRFAGARQRARSELADFLELAAAPKIHHVNFAVRVTLLERNEG